MSTKPDDQYGLLFEPVNRYGTQYIEVRVCRRDDKHEYPIGCPSDGDFFLGYGCPKHMLGLVVDGLGIYGFISDFDEPSYIGHDVDFRDCHSAGENKLKGMLKAIKKVNARIEKDKAREPGDKFAALAAALKLSFAVERIGSPSDCKLGSGAWRWMSVSDGRNRYRALIKEHVNLARKRKNMEVA